ncbi:hypothetical protein RSAG8_11505, partial [Rhizoctonia solani AG-8 WAC10335]
MNPSPGMLYGFSPIRPLNTRSYDHASSIYRFQEIGLIQ